METKICTKCSVEYPATKEFFYAHKDGKYGLNPQCKKCRLTSQKKYYAENIERHSRYFKKYYAENTEKYIEYSKKYHAEYPERYRMLNKMYREANHEKINEDARQRRKNNPEEKAYYNAKYKLKKQIGETPPPGLVEVKLLINKTKQLCKTLKS